MFQNLRQRASSKCNPSRMTWSREPALIFTLGARTRVENWEFRRILPNQVCPLLYRMVMASGWVSRVIFWGSSNQLNCPRWSSHHPVAEACYSKKKLQRVCTAGLCALDISSKLHHATWLDLVRDRYITDSLKGTPRAKQGKGMRRRVMSSGTEPASS